MRGNNWKMSGRVQTVLGNIDAEELEITLTHEHLLVNITVNFIEPREATSQRLAYLPVDPENINWLRHHIFGNPDNMCLLDEDVAIKELMRRRKRGWQYSRRSQHSAITLHSVPMVGKVYQNSH